MAVLLEADGIFVLKGKQKQNKTKNGTESFFAVKKMFSLHSCLVSAGVEINPAARRGSQCGGGTKK